MGRAVSSNVARHGLRLLLMGAIAVFAAGTAAAAVSHFHYPKTFHVVLKLDPRCSSAGLVRVGAHEWDGSGTHAKWPSSVTGVFKVISPHHAMFTADVGGQESFALLPKGYFWTMPCPLPQA